MTSQEKWDLLFKLIGIVFLVYLGLFLLYEALIGVKKMSFRKRSGKMKKELKK